MVLRRCAGSCAKAGLGRAAFDQDEPFDTLAPLQAAQRAVDRRLVRFCAELGDESALAQPVVLQRRSGPLSASSGQVLLHLFQHQIHHRGQAHAMLAGTKVPPPQLDEFFLDEDRPLRVAELTELGLPVR